MMMLSQSLLVLVATLLCLPGFGHFERRVPDKSFEEEIEENLRRRCFYGNCLKQHGEPILGGWLWRELQLPDAVGSRKLYEEMLIVPIENNGNGNYHEISRPGGSSWKQMGYRMYQTKVIGEDTRRLVGAGEAREASAVGMVVCQATVDGELHGTIGTGTMVGNRKTVLTSAHFSYERGEDGQPRYWFDVRRDCEFRIYIQGELKFNSRITNFEMGDNAGLDFATEDWAVMELQKRAPRKFPALGVHTLNVEMIRIDSSIPMETIAFHHDVGIERALYHSNGILKALIIEGIKVIAHTADTRGRASGAPILYRDKNGEATVIGIHVGQISGQPFNFMIPTNGSLFETLKAYVAQ